MNQFTPTIEHFSAIFRLKRDFPQSLKSLKKVAKEIIGLLHLEVVKETYHVFEPQGITLIYILSQSHISFHTWPESHLIYIDLVSCVRLKKEAIDNAIKKTFLGKNLSGYFLKKI